MLLRKMPHGLEGRMNPAGIQCELCVKSAEGDRMEPFVGLVMAVEHTEKFLRASRLTSWWRPRPERPRARRWLLLLAEWRVLV